MKFLLALLKAIPGVAAIVEKILAYFPPKTEGERAISNDRKKTSERKKASIKVGDAAKKAARGKHKNAKKILNG